MWEADVGVVWGGVGWGGVGCGVSRGGVGRRDEYVVVGGLAQ